MIRLLLVCHSDGIPFDQEQRHDTLPQLGADLIFPTIPKLREIHAAEPAVGHLQDQPLLYGALCRLFEYIETQLDPFLFHPFPMSYHSSNIAYFPFFRK